MTEPGASGDRAPRFPLSAISGHSLGRRALLCCAIDTGLFGVLLRGPPGSGKTFLLRAFAGFLAELEGRPAPLRRLPVGVDPERLSGGVDWQLSLQTGERHARSGLLDEVAGGLLVIEDLARLAPEVRGPVVAFLDAPPPVTRVLAAEGTTGRPVGSLGDRLPLVVPAHRVTDAAARTTLLERRQAFDLDPRAFREAFAAAEAALMEDVRRARGLLSRIPLEGSLIAELHAGPPAHGARGPLAAVRAARAHAALRGSSRVEQEDVQFAIAATLAERTGEDPESRAPQSRPGRRARPAESGGAGAVQDAGAADGGAGDGDDAAGPADQRVFDPAEGSMPAVDGPPVPARADAAVRAGRRAEAPALRRGRQAGQRTGGPSTGGLALAATLRRAALRGERRAGGGPLIRVRPEDVVRRRRRARIGTLFVIVADASGSMARNRMREAKSAVLGLLRSAYVHRDRVALVAFRGPGADVLLPPTCSPVRGERLLRLMPTGGATPLAAGIAAAARILAKERTARAGPASVVFLTDGRGNVPLDPACSDLEAELGALGRRWRALGVPTTVIDTRPPFDQRPHASQLAAALGARLARLGGPGGGIRALFDRGVQDTMGPCRTS